MAQTPTQLNQRQIISLEAPDVSIAAVANPVAAPVMAADTSRQYLSSAQQMLNNVTSFGRGIASVATLLEQKQELKPTATEKTMAEAQASEIALTATGKPFSETLAQGWEYVTSSANKPGLPGIVGSTIGEQGGQAFVQKQLEAWNSGTGGYIKGNSEVNQKLYIEEYKKNMESLDALNNPEYTSAAKRGFNVQALKGLQFLAQHDLNKAADVLKETTVSALNSKTSDLLSQGNLAKGFANINPLIAAAGFNTGQWAAALGASLLKGVGSGEMSPSQLEDFENILLNPTDPKSKVIITFTTLPEWEASKTKALEKRKEHFTQKMDEANQLENTKAFLAYKSRISNAKTPEEIDTIIEEATANIANFGASQANQARAFMSLTSEAEQTRNQLDIATLAALKEDERKQEKLQKEIAKAAQARQKIIDDKNDFVSKLERTQRSGVDSGTYNGLLEKYMELNGVTQEQAADALERQHEFPNILSLTKASDSLVKASSSLSQAGLSAEEEANILNATVEATMPVLQRLANTQSPANTSLVHFLSENSRDIELRRFNAFAMLMSAETNPTDTVIKKNIKRVATVDFNSPEVTPKLKQDVQSLVIQNLTGSTADRAKVGGLNSKQIESFTDTMLPLLATSNMTADAVAKAVTDTYKKTHTQVFVDSENPSTSPYVWVSKASFFNGDDSEENKGLFSNQILNWVKTKGANIEPLVKAFSEETPAKSWGIIENQLFSEEDLKKRIRIVPSGDYGDETVFISVGTQPLGKVNIRNLATASRMTDNDKLTAIAAVDNARTFLKDTRARLNRNDQSMFALDSKFMDEFKKARATLQLDLGVLDRAELKKILDEADSLRDSYNEKLQIRKTKGFYKTAYESLQSPLNNNLNDITYAIENAVPGHSLRQNDKITLDSSTIPSGMATTVADMAQHYLKDDATPPPENIYAAVSSTIWGRSSLPRQIEADENRKWLGMFSVKETPEGAYEFPAASLFKKNTAFTFDGIPQGDNRVIASKLYNKENKKNPLVGWAAYDKAQRESFYENVSRVEAAFENSGQKAVYEGLSKQPNKITALALLRQMMDTQEDFESTLSLMSQEGFSFNTSKDAIFGKMTNVPKSTRANAWGQFLLLWRGLPEWKVYNINTQKS